MTGAATNQIDCICGVWDFMQKRLDMSELRIAEQIKSVERNLRSIEDTVVKMQNQKKKGSLQSTSQAPEHIYPCF